MATVLLLTSGQSGFAFPIDDSPSNNQGQFYLRGFQVGSPTPGEYNPSLEPHLQTDTGQSHPIPSYTLGADDTKNASSYYKQLLEIQPVDRIQSKIFNEQAFQRIRKIGVVPFDNMTSRPYRDEAAGNVLAREVSRELDMVRTLQVIPPSLMADAQMKLVAPVPGAQPANQEEPSSPQQVRRIPYDKEQMDAVMIGAVTKYLKSYKDRRGEIRESLSSGLEFTAFLVDTETREVIWGARFVGSQKTGLSALGGGNATWLDKEEFSRSIMKQVLQAFYDRRPTLN